MSVGGLLDKVVGGFSEILWLRESRRSPGAPNTPK